MKRISIIIVGALFCLLHTYGQNDHCRKLVDLLLSNQCFPARDYIKQHKDSIAPYKEILTIYNYKMNDFMNRPDSAIYYLEGIIEEETFVEKNIGFHNYLLNELIRLYSEVNDYPNVVKTLERAERFINSIPQLSEQTKKQQLGIIAAGKACMDSCSTIPQPQLNEMTNKNVTTVPLTLHPDYSLISLPIKCNGESLQPIVDTGFQVYVFMTESEAKKCRLRKIFSPEVHQDSVNLNGQRIRGHFCMADSVLIGELLFMNIPVLVSENEFSELLLDSIDKEYAKHVKKGFSQPIIGLKLLKMLAALELDWHEKKVVFNASREIQMDENIEPNMYFLPGGLYFQLLVNQNMLSGFIDTGSNRCLDLSYSCYEKCSDEILLGPLVKKRAVGLAVYAEEYNFRSFLNPHVYVNDKKIDLQENDAVVSCSSLPDTWERLRGDMQLGCPFLWKLGKRVKFDFVNMRLTAE